MILVSHDRYLLDACAERLWRVADGSVKAFDGDMDDYRRMVLQQPARDTKPALAVAPKPEAQRVKQAPGTLRRQILAAEDRMLKFEGLLRRVDDLLGQPGAYAREPAKAAQLTQQRAELQRALVSAEEEWLTLSAEAEA